MIFKRFLAITAALALLAGAPAFANERLPLVINGGQTQQLQSTDTLVTPAPTTGNASIRLPHGTAPTGGALVDGACWTTTAGLFCRINGGTVGPYNTGSGGGTVTGSSLTGGAIVIGNGGSAIIVDANATLSNGALVLGASGTAGSIQMGNATSGTVTLQPVTGALGTVTASLPANTGTISEINLAETISGNKSFNDGTLILKGATSGTTTVKANATAGSTTITFPAATDTVAVLGTVDQTLSGGANLTPAALSTGNVTVDCGKNPGQTITNGGAYTITAPASDGMCVVKVTNNGSAGATSFSGFSPAACAGAALDTTNAHKFFIWVARIGGDSSCSILALQ